MKKSVLLTFLAGVVLFFGCAKDSELADSVRDLEKRVTTLEETVAQMNTEIAGIKNIITAIREGKDASFIYVKSVTPIPAEQGGGYSIVFSDGTTAEIHDGIQGPAGPEGPVGPAPVMGAKEVGGVFVWTANGEVIKDAEGNPVPVFGPLPQLRIKDGKWEVSYDEGKTWAVVPTMGQSGSAITIIDKENEVIFIIDGKEYSVKKEMPFFMEFSQRTDIGVKIGETAQIEYFIKGAAEADNVEVDILNITSAGWEAEVVSVATAETPGYIKVTNNDDSVAKIFVYATNGKGKTDIKSLQFEGGELKVVADVKPVEGVGGDIALDITTNMQYEVNKDPLASWITIVEPTKATHTDSYKITVSENKLGQFRSGNVYVVDTNSGETVETLTILQYPKATTTTDIYSLNRVLDGTTVKMYKLAVVAASQVSSVVTDGYDLLNVKGATLPVGKEVSLTGIKQSTVSAPYVEASSFEVTSETTTIETPEINWSMFAAYYAPLRTSLTSILYESQDGYAFGTVNGDEFFVEEPLEDISSCVGKLVNINGFSTEYLGDAEAGGYSAKFIANEVKALDLVDNSNWTLSFESTSSGDVLTNTVSGQTSNYRMKVYDPATISQLGVETPEELIQYSICYNVDDMMYYMYYQGKSYEDLVKSGTQSEKIGDLDYAKYVAIAVGIDENGLATGEYKYFEFEKKDPSVFGQYSDFLGKWDSSNGKFEIVAKEEGMTYTMKGFVPFNTFSGVADVEARYDSENGKLVLPEQAFADCTNPSYPEYGPMKDYMVGTFASGSKSYPTYPDNTENLEDLAIVSLLSDGTLKFKGTLVTEMADYGTFYRTGICFRWIIQTGEYAGLGNKYGTVSFPTDVARAQEESEAYKKWLGPWKIERQDYNPETWEPTGEKVVDVWSITSKKSNSSYSISNFEGVEDTYGTVTADFNEATGEMVVKTQVMTTWDFSGDTVTEALYGLYIDPSSGELYYTSEIGVELARFTLNDKGGADVKGGAYAGTVFTQMQHYQNVYGEDYVHNAFGYDLPNTMVSGSPAPTSKTGTVSRIIMSRMKDIPMASVKSNEIEKSGTRFVSVGGQSQSSNVMNVSKKHIQVK